MPTVTLQPELVEQLQQVASEQAVMPEELLETAVRTYLRQLECEKIKAEAEAFRSMHAELAQKYVGQYVAIHNGKMVDHDKDFQSLHSRIRQRFGRQPVLLRCVEAEPERILAFAAHDMERLGEANHEHDSGRIDGGRIETDHPRSSGTETIGDARGSR